MFSRVTDGGTPITAHDISKRMTNHQIIEISSDDDSDDEQLFPQYSRQIRPGASLARIATKNSPVDQNTLEISTGLQRFPADRTRQTKRQKLESFSDDQALSSDTIEVGTEKILPIIYEQTRPNLDELNHDIPHVHFDNGARAGRRTISVSHPSQSATVDVQRNLPTIPDIEKPNQLQPTVKVVRSRARVKSSKIAPYFDDLSLKVRLYRGKGYEMFPIVLGSRQDHQRLCDDWDDRAAGRFLRRRRLQTVTTHMGSYVDETIAVDSDDDSDTNEQTEHVADSASLLQILEILPDIEHHFVNQMIKERTQIIHNANDGVEMKILPDVHEIVADILEEESYPKQPSLEEEAADGTGITITFEKETVQTGKYLSDCVIILASHFKCVPTNYIHKAVHEKKSLFNSFKHIHAAESSYWTTRDKSYRRLRQPRFEIEKKYRAATGEILADNCWKNLVNELQAAKQCIERERLQALNVKELADREAANLQHHIDRNDCFECQCCFDNQVPNNRAVICDNGHEVHSFCFSCVRSLAETQLGMMKYELLCMDGSGCKAPLSVEGIAEAVPQKILDKLAYYQQQAEITAANIEGLEQCNFCDFKGICDPVEIDSLFRCCNPDCGRIACRKCHEPAHGSKSCEEAKIDKGLSARHKVEEARSEAMMRPCPGCNVKMVKIGGCNKIICTRCGCVSCFVCKKDISDKLQGGYQHFSGPGAHCSLNDNGNFDRHTHDADEAEKQAIVNVRAENADLDEAQLRIETSNIATNDTPGSSQRQRRQLAQMAQPIIDNYMRIPQWRHRVQPQFDQGQVRETMLRQQKRGTPTPIQFLDPITTMMMQDTQNTRGEARLDFWQTDSNFHTAPNYVQGDVQPQISQNVRKTLDGTARQQWLPHLPSIHPEPNVNIPPPHQRKFNLADADWILGENRIANPMPYQNMVPQQGIGAANSVELPPYEIHDAQTPFPDIHTVNERENSHLGPAIPFSLHHHSDEHLTGALSAHHMNFDTHPRATDHRAW